MAKKKKQWQKNWDLEKWTPFEERDTSHYPPGARPNRSFVNSIYQVSVWYGRHQVFGEFAHLSFKTHDRQARHDWREMQRIKNELCGDETWAVEFYPPESRVVDTSNQYHLYVFKDFKFEGIGFVERLVSESETHNTKQRPFRPEFRPKDLVTEEEMKKQLDAYLKGPR